MREEGSPRALLSLTALPGFSIPTKHTRAEQAIRRRYGLPAKILPILYTIRDKLRHRTFGPIIGLEITLDGRRQE